MIYREVTCPVCVGLSVAAGEYRPGNMVYGAGNQLWQCRDCRSRVGSKELFALLFIASIGLVKLGVSTEVLVGDIEHVTRVVAGED